MKKLIISSLIVFSLEASKAALAQSNFDGAYAGLGAGYSWGEDNGKEYHDAGGIYYGSTQQTRPTGTLLSPFIGFNKVVNQNILLGAEADYDMRDYADKSVQKTDGVGIALYPVETRVQNGKSLRARLGYVFNNDKTLSYLTGGYSTININRTYGDLDNNLGNGTAFSKITRHNGYIVGFGMEHFVTDKISLRAEYRYAQYGTKMLDASKIYGTGALEKQKFFDQSLRVGIAYNF